MTVAAWLSVYAERWDCKVCIAGKRRESYVCPNREGDINEAMRRLSQFDTEDFPGILDRYDRSGVCPYMLITPLVREFASSRRWVESGNIGFSFLEAPQWYLEALALYDTETGRAMRFRQAEGAANGNGRKRK